MIIHKGAKIYSLKNDSEMLLSISYLTTLEYGVMVPSEINVPPGKFVKNNKRTPWNNHTPLKTQNMGCSPKEHFFR